MITTPVLSALLFGARPADELAAFRSGLAGLVGREVELVVALRPAAPAIEAGAHRVVVADGTMAAARNAAVAAARAASCVFVESEEDLQSSFIEHACRLLDRDAAIDFITAWGEGVPVSAQSVARSLEPLALVARPWFVHVPTVFRRAAWERAGGFDEELVAFEEVDLLLRLVETGARGLALPDGRLRTCGWGESFDYRAPAALEAGRRLYHKHRARIENDWEAALLGKERIVRELHAVRLPVERDAIALTREAEAVELALESAQARDRARDLR